MVGAEELELPGLEAEVLIPVANSLEELPFLSNLRLRRPSTL